MLHSMPSAPQKVHFFYLPPVRFTRFHYIYPRRIDACVSQYIRKMRDILIDRVKIPRKQMPKVMRKDLFPRDSGKGAKLFHIGCDFFHKWSAPFFFKCSLSEKPPVPIFSKKGHCPKSARIRRFETMPRKDSPEKMPFYFVNTLYIIISASPRVTDLCG